MKTTKQVGLKPGRKTDKTQAGKPSTGGPVSLVVTNFQDWNDSSVELTPAEVRSLHLLAVSRRPPGISLAETVKLALQGFFSFGATLDREFEAARAEIKRTGQPHSGVLLILQSLRDSLTLRRCQLAVCLDLMSDVDDSDELKKRVTAGLHCLEINEQVVAKAMGAPTPTPHVPSAESGNEPAQGEPGTSSVPDRGALELLAGRVGVEAEAEMFLKTSIALTLPGLAFGEWKIDELLWRLTAGIYFTRATALIQELILSRVSAWEAVELAEVLSIAEELQEGNEDRARDESSRLSLNEWYGCSSHRRVKDPFLLVHCAFVVFQHAGAISREVLPRVSELPEAAQLAEALVIAEAVVNTVEKRAVGTVAQPTALQQQAVDLTARMWREWPRKQSFSQDIPGKPGGLAALVGKPTVAA